MDKEVLDILVENSRRVAYINEKGDQITGKGCDGHDYVCRIPDYALKVQWLTEETYEHPVYKTIRKLKTVSALADKLGCSDKEVCTLLMYARCKTDPWFAFATCFHIMNKITGHLMPFILNNPQRILLNELERMRRDDVPIRLVLLKARQWGGSTLTQLYMAWIQLFRKTGWNSVIIAQTKDTARRIKAMYRTVLREFPADLIGQDSLEFRPKENSTADSIISNGHGDDVFLSILTVASFENFDTTRGANFSMAHYSEVAYWVDTDKKTASQVITGVDGGISLVPETLEVMESTANGMSGLFYDEYQKAKAGESAYRALFIPFFCIEHDSIPFKSESEKEEFARNLYDGRVEVTAPNSSCEPGKYLWSLWQKGATLEAINWYVQKRKGFHFHDQMASEAPSDDIECFRYSGANVFSQMSVNEQQKMFVSNPRWTGNVTGEKGKNVRLVENEFGDLRIWKEPDGGNARNRYIVSVDVGGRSEHADYSVITVLDRQPYYMGGRMECVARWRGHLRYDLMAWKAVQIAVHYNNALLVFESNTLDKKLADAREGIREGDHIRGILEEIEGHYKNLYYRRATNNEDIMQGFVKKVGFQTNVKTKQDMVDCFTVMFEDGKYCDHDLRFYQEAAIYTQFPNGSYGNIPGANNHDDILMSVMIGVLVSREVPAPQQPRPDDIVLIERPRCESETVNESFF